MLLFRKGSDYVAKLCDFGFSILLADVEGSRARLHGGAAFWMAPECLTQDELLTGTLKRTDFHLLGLLFWRLLLDGYNPFNIPGLTRGRDHDVLKLSADPSLLAIAQFPILLVEEFKSRSNEIF